MRVLVWLAGFMLAAGVAADILSVNDTLTPREQYRRLSLVLLIGEGVNEVLYQSLHSAYSPPQPLNEPVNPDELRSPLLRIVDQDSMLTGTSHLFRIAVEHGPEVARRLRALDERYPEDIQRVSLAALQEDAILVRMAIADSIAWSGLDADEDVSHALAVYRARTLELRNLLEYEQFNQELGRMTAEAIASVGSKLDAYQRMFDDEVQDDTFDRHIRSAERPYQGRGALNEDAARVAEEVMNGVVLSESQPVP